MKKGLTIAGIVVGSLIVGALGLMFILYTIGNALTDDSSTEKAASTEEVKELHVFDKSVYDKIKQGDVLTGAGGSTYDEVIELLGEPTDKTHSESTVSGSTSKDIDCTWYDDNFDMISVNFTNGRVSYKMYTE